MLEEDIPAVEEIEFHNLTPWSFSSLKQELDFHQGLCLVALTADQRVCGWCACRRVWPEAELLKIAVVEQMKKRGIGSSLLHYLIEDLQQRDFTFLFLEVRSQNLSALSFYYHHGLHQVGVRYGYYVDPKDDALILKRDI
jgi:ribosomal-protein-alanine acetyltransferase